MISLERFRRELGADCPATEAELRELYEQMSTLASVAVGALRSGTGLGGKGSGASRRDARSPSADGDGQGIDDMDLQERAAILEFDGRLDRREAERLAARMSKRNPRGESH